MPNNKLQKINKTSLTSEFKDKLTECGFSDLQVGDSLYYNDRYYGRFYLINKINKKGLHYKYTATITYTNEKDGSTYKKDEIRNDCISWNDLKEYGSKYIKMEMSKEEYEKEATEFFLNPEEYEIKQKLLTANSKEADTTALMIVGTDVNLMNSKSLLQKLTDKMVILNHLLENKKRQMERMRDEFMEKLKHINRVITILEIYMGIDEEIVQFKEGSNALFDEPLHFRQKLLYMDEELADNDYLVEGGGADSNDIDVFEKWLIENDNYKLLVPEQKCVVVLRPRRDEKKYSDNPWINAIMNSSNFRTFVLIRNGENLYRIWTNKFNIEQRLFPKVDQFDKIEVWEEHFGEKRKRWKYKGHYHNDEEVEKAKEHFKFNVLMMQGLMDRTDIFKPIKDKVNLFDPRTYGDSVKLIVDDEFVVHTGKPKFKEYISQLNNQIKRGSRIYLRGIVGYAEDYKDRFRIKYYNSYNVPNKPDEGIYTVETMKVYEWDNVEESKIESYYDRHYYYDKNKYKTVKEYANSDILYISYNPGGTIVNHWDRWDDGHERKNKVKFEIDYNYDTIFNYDLLDLDEIDYYLKDRIERRDYLYMFPIAKDLKKIREEELKWEKSFVRLVKDRNECSEELVWECVEWWKLKNIWKRPIRQDDAKALRMIESRIKTKLKNEIKNKKS